MNLGIAVMSFKRPRYLHVTLSALFRVLGIENHSVEVYFDGPQTPEMRKDNMTTLSYFPVDKIVFSSEWLGLLQSHMSAIKGVFESGCDYVLYLEEDLIIRPNTLVDLEENWFEMKRGFFISLFGKFHDDMTPQGIRYEIGDYCPWGVIISRESFDLLSQLIDSGSYLGLPWKGRDKNLYEYPKTELATHDGIFKALALRYDLVRVLPDQHYVANFGIRGSRQKTSDIVAKLQEKMFAGERDTWLGNVLKMLAEGDCPEELAKQFFPKHFIYE